jgi:RES domain-containing protein
VLTVWRITKSRHAFAAFDGEGARRFGGRWNSPGLPAVYASETRALAMLEVLAGLGETAKLDAYVLIGASIEESLVHELDVRLLPNGWRAYPPPPAVQALGDAWLAQATSPVLRVPSALVPHEWNYVLNPRHPNFTRIQISAPEPAPLDPRLLR